MSQLALQTAEAQLYRLAILKHGVCKQAAHAAMAPGLL